MQGPRISNRCIYGPNTHVQKKDVIFPCFSFFFFCSLCTGTSTWATGSYAEEDEDEEEEDDEDDDCTEAERLKERSVVDSRVGNGCVSDLQTARGAVISTGAATSCDLRATCALRAATTAKTGLAAFSFAFARSRLYAALHFSNKALISAFASGHLFQTPASTGGSIVLLSSTAVTRSCCSRSIKGGSNAASTSDSNSETSSLPFVISSFVSLAVLTLSWSNIDPRRRLFRLAILAFALSAFDSHFPLRPWRSLESFDRNFLVAKVSRRRHILSVFRTTILRKPLERA
mmetsp:Transcript_20933/g.55852  ORF Transcript_20933/g.55852 Transcript_20933/m.55852 type:complete len:288 (-) Transcript_20933:4-867(-)